MSSAELRAALKPLEWTPQFICEIRWGTDLRNSKCICRPDTAIAYVKYRRPSVGLVYGSYACAICLERLRRNRWLVEMSLL